MEAAAAPQKRMSLGAITSGVVTAPVKTTIYGPEGVGKTKFASGAPAPIYIPIEEGTNTFDVKRFPAPETFSDVLEAIVELGKGEHSYRTVVLDTLDALEPLIWRHVCDAGKKDSIEDFGYGRGYTAALDQWRTLLAYLERLRKAKSMNVVLIAHAQIKKFQNPESADFDRWELKLAGKGASGLVKEWSDNLLFATYEVVAATDKSDRTRGVSTGQRIARTVHSGAFDAKYRYSLPDPMPLEWSAYRDAMRSYLNPQKTEEVKS